MAVVRTATLISAPIEVVFDLACDLLAPNARVVAVDRPRRFVEVTDHPRWRSIRQVHRFVQTGAGTLMTDETEWAAPLAPLGRRRVLRLMLARGDLLRRLAENAAGPAGAAGRAVVVGAALLDGTGRVLAAQRAGPAAVAGGWEFPGGKVEPGESDDAALVRECREELGVEVTLDRRLGDDVPVQDGGGVLRVWTGRIVAGTPVPREHAALRWLSADELDSVDWLPADRPIVDLLRVLPR